MVKRDFMENKLEFSKRLGVNQQQYGRYEQAVYSPSLEVALSIAKILNLSVEDIWSLEKVDQLNIDTKSGLKQNDLSNLKEQKI